ncbi:hypothetical protein ABB37_09353 [Leptomonas pyrrhocoris]|uniref:Uncharacterized protein n=1 Tax=Leptomonas pyrrhocoris TaxID=157538 RepID=A0A0M9FQP4_LEPPY|nr:hypothetical protein ABB37_09353 [Leptomonas pyrrhocoris]KPA74043.1 hypothetical protein ABB37_09353 [Leptomonas pyrrhocoris]|eukprot:XP_015652482.1 hypothetical protein ABB37_09353 [Leptomonas pyrrhocoris]
MIAECFYLLTFITTVITLTASDINIWPDGMYFVLGWQSAVVSNVRPHALQFGVTTVNSTSSGLTVTFNDPVKANLTTDLVVNGDFELTDVFVEANVSGSVQVAKEVSNTCGAGTFSMTNCNITLNAVAYLPFIGSFTIDNQDVCDYADIVVTGMLTPKPYQEYPAPQQGTTSLEQSTYLMKLKLLNLFANSTGMPVSADFVAPNVLRLAIAAPIGQSLSFNSEQASDVGVFDAMIVFTQFARKMLDITVDPDTDNTTVIPYGANGEIRVPALRNIIHQAIIEGTLVSMETYVPRSSGLVYDVIVNDFRCKYFNTVCSLPAEGGVQVINSRLVGLGDLSSILDNVAGAMVDELLTNLTSAAFKIAGSTFGDRIYLPVL